MLLVETQKRQTCVEILRPCFLYNANEQCWNERLPLPVHAIHAIQLLCSAFFPFVDFAVNYLSLLWDQAAVCWMGTLRFLVSFVAGYNKDRWILDNATIYTSWGWWMLDWLIAEFPNCWEVWKAFSLCKFLSQSMTNLCYIKWRCTNSLGNTQRYESIESNFSSSH